MVQVVTIPFRRSLVGAAFLAAIILVAVLGREESAQAAGSPGAVGFHFENVAPGAGLDFVHHGPVLDARLDNVGPLIAAMGASVSVADVDRDGWPDLYLTNSRFGFPNALYINRHDGTFVNRAAEAGIADLNRPGEGVSMGAVWGDLDNDGREDLLVYKYGYLQLFRNLGGLRFEDITERAGLRQWMNSNGAIWLDYDRDGLLDLYVTAYFRPDVDLWHVQSTRIMHNSWEFATNGGTNRLFHNVGGGRFEDLTASTGTGSTRWTLAAGSADFNHDGWPDLFLANDYGPEELYLNEGGRRFILTRSGLESDSKSGMSVTLGDVLNRGRLDVFVTNISEPGYLFQGNNLRLNFLAELGRFEQGAGKGGVIANAGWAWGAQLGDLDNDGRNELFIVNGYVSADRDRDYWYGMSKVAGANGNLFEDTRNWAPIGRASLSGFERSRVLVNRDGEAWQDVAGQVGVGDEYDGRAIALADLWNRGVLDAIVANQAQPVLLYRNTVPAGNHWVALELVGSRSNRSAIGAEVTAFAPGFRQLRVVDGGMGFASQNDRRLHFGLGSRAALDSIQIQWPSGVRQTLTRLEVDRFHRLVEPGPTP